MRKRIHLNSRKTSRTPPRGGSSLFEVEALRSQVAELTATIDAIRNGEIDGLIMSEGDRDQVYTLQSAEHPYRVLVEEMSEGAVTLVENDIVSYGNNSFAKMLGLRLETVVGHPVYDLVSTSVAKKLRKFLNDAWLNGNGREEFTVGIDANVKPVLISASLIELPAIRSLCLIITDLTGQKQTEIMKREQATREQEVSRLESERHIADTANRAKSNFLANMSHEIRTPLGAILGFAQLMQDPTQNAVDREECLSTILRNGDLLARVINEVLDLSKIDSDKMEIERIEFSLPELLKDVTSLLRLKAAEKNLALEVAYSTEVPESLISDPTRLRQILINIIGNAIKFTAKGSVHLDVSIRKLSGSDILASICISDTGIGMTEDQHQNLFQPFSQADTSTTRKHGGSGLGLYLSRKLAKVLGGDVAILKTDSGVGTTFEVTIQAEAIWDVTTRPKPEVSSVSPTPRSMNGLRVLVVDDAPDNRSLVSCFLKAAGAKVECASNGMDGVQKALRYSFDVVLMDIQMPGLDGFDSLTQLKKLNYQKPVIALTAHAMKGDRERSLSAGFDDHLAKPIDRQKLVAAVLSSTKRNEN